MKPVLVISGPTSTGKTSLGLSLAKELDAVIISADSRQIYKYMDIGTGKLPILSDAHVVKKSEFWEINGVSVYGYDLVSPDQPYSAHEYSNYARHLLSNFISQDKNVIVIGGTGFYIDTLLGRITPSNTPPNVEFREQHNTLPLSELQQKLLNISPQIYESIDNKNKVRIIRVLEKLTLPSQKVEVIDLPKSILFHQIGLRAKNEFMFTKADVWTKNVWENGLFEETEKLIQMGYENTQPLNGLIYKTVKEFIKGLTTKEKAIERIQFDIHAYIRRQLTWFKKNSDIHWYDVADMSQDQIKSAILNIFSV